MRRIVTGEQVARLSNPDPFALPHLARPGLPDPGRDRHPRPARPAAGPPGPAGLRGTPWPRASWRWWRSSGWSWAGLPSSPWPPRSSRCWSSGGGSGRSRSPAGLTRPARGAWRAWRYRRRWAGVLTIAGVAPWYQGRVILPVLGKVTATRYTDRVQVRLVSGQSAADFAKCADNLAHGFGACCAGSARPGPGGWCWSSSAATPWPPSSPPIPIPADPDLKALPVGRREDGLPWLVRLHGTHVLIAGATGAGKASLLWGLVRAMFPLMQAGLVQVLAADPKLMELAYGRIIFDAYGQYAADPAAIAAMLDRAIADMQDRAAGSPDGSATTPRPSRTRSPWSWSMRWRS